MKKIIYFKKPNDAPKGAEFLCLKRVLVKDDGKRLIYEDIFVYEVEQDLKKIRKLYEQT